MVWYIRTVDIFLGVIDMFSDSVFDFSLCLSYILFVTFFAFYAIDQVGAIAGYIMFCCVCYITSLVSDAALCAQHFTIFAVFLVADICVCIRCFLLLVRCIFAILCSCCYEKVPQVFLSFVTCDQCAAIHVFSGFGSAQKLPFFLITSVILFLHGLNVVVMKILSSFCSYF